MQTRMKTHSRIKLHAGGGIRFGFMRQNNLSGRTLSVTDVTSYIFDNDSFASYQLRDEDTDVSVILAESENPQDAYMAISLALKDRWYSGLFSAQPPKEWLRLNPGDSVKVAHDAVVMPQGWLLADYRHVLTARGSKLSGDFRQRMSELAEYYADPFDYVLLVSEDGEYAIELEKYENGTMKIYATVYRPMTDISETTPYHRPYIVANNTPAETVKPKEQPIAVRVEEVAAAQPLTLVSDAGKAAATAEMKPDSMEVKTEDPASITVPLPPMEVATIAVSHAISAAPEQMLTFNALLAARIIEEARRNKLSLADVIRKVIDLPKEMNDVIYVPFELNEKEQAMLAKRYGMDESNHAGVQAKIVEELKQFAGVK